MWNDGVRGMCERDMPAGEKTVAVKVTDMLGGSPGMGVGLFRQQICINKRRLRNG